eukprot:s1782_g15.t1
MYWSCGEPGSRSSWPDGRKPGTGGPSYLAVVEIRKRVMRDAEEAFAQKLQAPAEETKSYQTASSGRDGGQTLGGQQNVPTGGWVWIPEGGGQTWGSVWLSYQNLELPKLPSPGSEGAPLQFGDWVTVVYPIMCDVAGSAKEWWSQTVSTVEHHYVQWLSAALLEKLRMKPEARRLAEQFARLEQRGISMLLGCMPEALRQETIAGPGVLLQVGRGGHQDGSFDGCWRGKLCQTCRSFCLFAAVPEKEGAEGGKDGQRPPTVLQTYAVPLAMVKTDLDSWIESIKAEYRQLVHESQAVKPIHVKELERMEGYKDMELAPSKLVTTVKSPNGKQGTDCDLWQSGGQRRG